MDTAELILQKTELILQKLYANAELLERHLINIESGIQVLMYVAIGFLVWAVIKALYKLFGGIFFGGV